MKKAINDLNFKTNISSFKGINRQEIRGRLALEFNVSKNQACRIINADSIIANISKLMISLLIDLVRKGTKIIYI